MKNWKIIFLVWIKCKELNKNQIKKNKIFHFFWGLALATFLFENFREILPKFFKNFEKIFEISKRTSLLIFFKVLAIQKISASCHGHPYRIYHPEIAYHSIPPSRQLIESDRIRSVRLPTYRVTKATMLKSVSSRFWGLENLGFLGFGFWILGFWVEISVTIPGILEIFRNFS